MAESWLLHQQGRETFLTREELERRATEGQVAAGDLVYHPVLGRWLYAAQVDELRPLLAAPRPLAASPLARSSDALAVRPSAALAAAEVPNDAAIAGFTLGMLGLIPIFGAACALVGLPLSVRGVRRSLDTGGIDRRFAVAGMVLTLASLAIHGGILLLAFLD